MNKELALLMLDALEELTIENLTLRSILLQANRNATEEKTDVMLAGARQNPKVRDTVRAQWLPLRRVLEEDSALEEALKQFRKIVPPPKGVN